MLQETPNPAAGVSICLREPHTCPQVFSRQPGTSLQNINNSATRRIFMSLSRLQSLSDGDKWHSRTTGTLQASPLILTEVEQQTGKCMGFQHQQFIFSIRKTKPYIKIIHGSFLFKTFKRLPENVSVWPTPTSTVHKQGKLTSRDYGYSTNLQETNPSLQLPFHLFYLQYGESSRAAQIAGSNHSCKTAHPKRCISTGEWKLCTRRTNSKLFLVYTRLVSVVQRLERQKQWSGTDYTYAGYSPTPRS